MKSIIPRFITLFLFTSLVSLSPGITAEQNTPPNEGTPPTLKEAVTCEGVKDGLPIDQTIVFDVSKGSAYCYSDFDPVWEDGIIYHKWYRNGELINDFRLAVHPPRWAVYSSLRLRQADVGPWRLEITNEKDEILTTIRFSITE